MNTLETVRSWLATFPQFDVLSGFQVDFTDKIPCTGGILPDGLVEVSRKRDIVGNVTVTNQYNFGLYYVFEKAPNDDAGAEKNADWIVDLQEWVQEQSAAGTAPVFGDDPREGRCLLTGLPKVVTVSSTEMMDAFEEPVERIMEAIHSVLERTPPELVADVSTNGIIMTGGGSLVYGFDKLVTARTGIHTTVAEDAISCVVLGTGKSLDSLNSMQDGTMNLSRRKQMT